MAERERRTENGLKKELLTPDGYKWSVYDFDTGLGLLALEDINSGTTLSTPIVRADTRLAAHKAWLGARQSRASGTPWEILFEMDQKGVDPNLKLEETFSGYGHKSVGDIARLQVGYTGIPIHLCTASFLDMAVNSGQEKSTRYQKSFGRSNLHGLFNYIDGKGLTTTQKESMEREYQSFGELSLQLFAKYRTLLLPILTAKFNPDKDNANQKGALDNRVLDCARLFLLWGQSTGMEIETSARDWSRVIADFKASPVLYYQKVGRQLERLFTPSREEEEQLGVLAEAPGLIRHADSDMTTNNNLEKLRQYLLQTDFYSEICTIPEFANGQERKLKLINEKYTEGEKIAAQYIQAIHPGANFDELLEWAHNNFTNIKKDIGKIIFEGHNNYTETTYLTRVTGQTVELGTYLAIARDWLRHRSAGRTLSIPQLFGPKITFEKACAIISKGFGLPVYYSEIPELQMARLEYEYDMQLYYKKLNEFLVRYSNTCGSRADCSFILNLLPLGHRVDLMMHWDPKGVAYSTHQRVRPGGDFTYRVDAHEMNDAIANSDPYLEGMRLKVDRPNPNDIKSFFDRS